MSDEQSPFHALLEGPEKALHATRESVAQAEQEAQEWPAAQEKLSSTVLPHLRQWRNHLERLQRPIDRRKLHKAVRRLRLRYTIPWFHIPVLYAAGRVILLSLVVALVWLWTRRWQVLALVLFLTALYFSPRIISYLLSLFEDFRQSLLGERPLWPAPVMVARFFPIHEWVF